MVNRVWNMNGKQLYLKHDEAKFLAMAVLSQIELLEDNSKNQLINWTPESRRDLKEMITAGKSLRVKMKSIGIDMIDLPEYFDGDEDEFLTKQS